MNDLKELIVRKVTGPFLLVCAVKSRKTPVATNFHSHPDPHLGQVKHAIQNAVSLLHEV